MCGFFNPKKEAFGNRLLNKKRNEQPSKDYQIKKSRCEKNRFERGASKKKPGLLIKIPASFNQKGNKRGQLFFFISLPGLPTTTALSGTSRMMTAPAPMVAHFPILIFWMEQALIPKSQPSSI